MSTTIRPQVSKKKDYYISKHRYYELKHFCLQYPEWRTEYNQLYFEPRGILVKDRVQEDKDDITATIAIRRRDLFNKMEMVEQAAIEADPDLKDYILLAVTDGYTYEYLKLKKNIPCGRDTFYNRYRRFFWVLSKVR